MSDESTAKPWNLGSDLPLVDPADDEYGYAPFASRMAAAIVDSQSPQGLVIAVHGEWGSGKSSMMNFIKHDLMSLPESGRPVLIDFNPWWFEGREQIAAQLLEQFSAQLPDRLRHVRALARLVGKYSKQIADAAADVSGYGWIKRPLAWLLGWIPGLGFLSEKTGIPSIKKKVADALRSSGKRFVFFVDDIDRLTPDEARDFFRAIKALADFPEVVYVLFFDRAQVAAALSASLKMDGEAYLEKIVQAPFHLPAVDKARLQQKLFKGLDAIIESKPMPFAFEQGRWAEVWQDGLDRCVRKPRDVVRILNAISVAYPPVAGEVNPVDFIALEFLRVFEPTVYGSIRDGKEFFCGAPTQLDHEKPQEKAYFEKWRDELPERSRDWLVELVGRIFPKVAKVLKGNRHLFRDDGSWRRELRPCSADCFDVYFQFGVPAGHVSRAELDRLVGESTAEGMAALLMEARGHVFPDGHSKARDLLDRLRDFDQIDADQARLLVEALISHAASLLRKEDGRGGFFSIPNRWRLSGLWNMLLGRLGVPEREALILWLAERSPSVWGLVELADDALQAKRDPSKGSQAMLELSEGFPDTLAALVGARLGHASLGELMAMPELDFVVHRWSQWGDAARIREVFAPMLESDDLLLALLDKFIRTGYRSSGRETTETYQLSMTALSLVMDVQAMAPRIEAIRARQDLTPRQRAATDGFMRGLRRIAEGKDPDGGRFEDV